MNGTSGLGTSKRAEALKGNGTSFAFCSTSFFKRIWLRMLYRLSISFVLS